jgi:hypothetical protein
VASAWLTCFGWAGLVAFKLTMVCFIGVLAIFISLYRPRASGGVLMFGCAVTAGVVLYSFYLSHLIANHTAELVAEAAAQQTLADASAQQQRREVYRQFMERLRGDLIAGRSSLRHAVDDLERFEATRNPVWLSVYQHLYPGLSRREYLALHVIYHTIVPLNSQATQTKQLTLHMRGQYQETFGKPLPIELGRTEAPAVHIAAKKE